MSREELLAFLRAHRLMVQSSIGALGAPQAAVVGFAVSDSLEFVFDTLQTTRKYGNIIADPRVALVIGWDDRTVQVEGVADVPQGAERNRMRECYFEAHPDGRERLLWPGLVHVRVIPTWLRYSDFRVTPEKLIEFEV